MGLVFQTSQWTDSLWAGHVKHSHTALAVVADGRQKHAEFPQFCTDIHASLYLHHAPHVQDNAPAWANALLNQAMDLQEWTSLKSRCLRNGFAAGVAAETILQALLPLVPHGQKDAPQGADSATTRRQMRQACREAGKAIDTAESALEGLTEALGLAAGDGVGSGETMADIDQLRSLYALLRDNPTMRRIAEMAGRLQRLGASHKRCQVTPAVGAIKGITIGGDLDRLLPGELVGLRSGNRVERLRTLQRIMDKRAMQYLMQGAQSEVRGPIIVAVDESSSVRLSGVDTWCKAVALALLSTAIEQRRAYTLLGFTMEVEHEMTVLPGEASMQALLPHLTRHCRGGTSFDAALTRALEVLHTAPSMHQADIIFITDGEDSISPELVEAIAHAQKENGVHVYAICVGQDANPESLRAIANEVYHVSESPEHDSATVAPCIALVR